MLHWPELEEPTDIVSIAVQDWFIIQDYQIPKAPNEHRVLVYACPDCTEDFEKPKMFSIKRNVTEDPLETVEIEIIQTQKKLAKSK